MTKNGTERSLVDYAEHFANAIKPACVFDQEAKRLIGELVAEVTRIRAAATTVSDFEQVFVDICNELGCAKDNEAALEAIATLRVAPRPAQDPIAPHQSDEAVRNMIAKEIWRYQECEEAYGPFDDVSSKSIGMAELIKQTAIDQAEMIRGVILGSMAVKAYFAQSITEDDVYEIGKRDGYEGAIQTLDLMTGGDGEFKGSTIPGETIDVPAMQTRIVDRFATRPTLPTREAERAAFIAGFEAFPGPKGQWDREKISRDAVAEWEKFSQSGERD